MRCAVGHVPGRRAALGDRVRAAAARTERSAGLLYAVGVRRGAVGGLGRGSTGNRRGRLRRRTDHALIARWRRAQALRRTLDRRPDLLGPRALTAEERESVARRRVSLQNATLILVALNLVVIILLPPFESVYAITKASIPTFEGFYFIFARHAESTANVLRLINSDPSRSIPLTARGREQAAYLRGAD